MFINQFFISDYSFEIPQEYDILKVRGSSLSLYYHKKINIEYRVKDSKSIYLIGFFFNPVNNEPSGVILEKMINAKDLEEVLSIREKLSGRYALLYIDSDKSVILSDFFNERQLYYFENGNKKIISSSDKLILDILKIPAQINETKKKLIIDKDFLYKDEHFFLGYHDWDDRIVKLLPESYLNLNTFTVKRIENYNIKKISYNDLKDLYIKVTLNNLRYYKSKYSNIYIALTGGIDSRLLLAVSRKLNFDFKFFTFTRESESSQLDGEIASKIADQYQLNYNNYKLNDIREEFIHDYSENFIVPRKLSKTKNIQWFKDNIQGKDSLILTTSCSCYIRGFFEDIDFENSREAINQLYTNYNEFHENELKTWLNSGVREYISSPDNNFLTMGTMFNVEVRSGKYGSRSIYEHDYCGFDYISPFNNKYLQYTALKSLNKKGDALHKSIINELLPEIKKIPINLKKKTIRHKIAESFPWLYKLIKLIKR